MKGYKVFKPDFTCRGFKYEVGKTYKHNGPISICRSGFHFCRNVADCFNYYGFDPKNKVAEIEATGLVESTEDKSVTDEITIVREIPWEEMLTLANTGKGCTGAMPFSQLERDFSRKKTQYSLEWRRFERMWQRPALTKAHMKAVEAGEPELYEMEERKI